MHQSRRPTIRHVPALDGLRGLAVIAVVAFHAGIVGADGGYLGVSAFFTLSGYLITSLLLAEHDRDGRVSLRAFWTRRFRRLLPAALATIAGVVVAARFLADSGQLADLRGDVLAGIGYVANWRFVLEERSYAELFTGPSPLQHLWSLAIEEQFYVLFPLLTVGLLRLGRGRRHVLGSALVVLSVASVLWSAHLAGLSGGTTRAYYDTGARAVELLAGALLAVVLAGRVERLERYRRSASRVGAAALVLVLAAWSTVAQDDPRLHQGLLAAHALLVVAVLVAAHVPGPVRTLGSSAPLRLVGRVSYGVYLVHWPVFVWLDADRAGVDGPALLVLRLGVTAGLAAVSYHLVEQPIRRRTVPIDRRGLAVALSSVVVVIGGTAAVTTWTSPRDQILVALEELRSVDEPPASAEGGDSVEGTDRGAVTSMEPLDTVLLVGDSVMAQAYDHHRERFAEAGITTWFAGGPGTGPLSPQGSWLEQVRSWVAAVDVDVVVIEACCNYTMGSEDRYVDDDGTVVEPGSEAVLTAWEHEVRRLVGAASSRGAVVALVRFGPVETNGWYGPLEQHVAATDALYERLAAELDLHLVDWAAALAPEGRFTSELLVGGAPVVVRIEDGVHLTPEGSDLVAQVSLEQVLELADSVARRRAG